MCTNSSHSIQRLSGEGLAVHPSEKYLSNRQVSKQLSVYPIEIKVVPQFRTVRGWGM